MHSLLKRQLKRQFGEQVPENLLPFLDVINRAYQDFDADRLMLERSLDLSSRELLRANTDLRALIGAFPDIFFRLDQDGRILDCKGGYQESFALPVEQLIGKRIQDIPAPRVGQAFQEALERIRGTCAPVSLEYSLHLRGNEEFFEARILPVFEGQFMVIIRNITERKKTESSLMSAQDQLRQSQKMEAVGRLAGGVAHDFNNLLTAIRGYCDLALTRLGDAILLRKNLLEIRKVSDRAALLTRQLLAFSRRQVLQPKLLDLNESVNNMDALLRRLIGETVELTVILDPQLRRVKADPGQIEQVIMNLVLNARDAQPSGGRIIIETANQRDDEGHMTNQTLLSVTDTGHGMDQETMSHIFEPFFTTKVAGRGTGLGLSMVYGIVKQSGGNIWVESETEWGCTFRISLPSIEGAAGAAPAEGGELGSASGSETILLVEDEDIVREVTGDILQTVGYKVLIARNGAEALRIFEEHQGPIQLMVTDLVMPGMSGRELAKFVLKDYPATKVLYTSGYTDDTVFFNGTLDEHTPFLQKPFTADSLTRRVRELLEMPPRA
jgi:two-component system, cell cycle sensor histidine kinase and response regulator CckA